MALEHQCKFDAERLRGYRKSSIGLRETISFLAVARLHWMYWMAHRSTMAGSCICILLEVEEKPPTPDSRAKKETAESIPFQLLWSYRGALQEGNQPPIEAGYLGRVLL